MDELLVTSAKVGADDFEEYPLSGSVFKVTGLGVTGAPVSVYEG